MAEAMAMPAPNMAVRSALAAAKGMPPAATSAAAASGQTASTTAASPAEAAKASPSSAQPANAQAKPQAAVEGYEVKEQQSTSNVMTPEVRNWALAGFALLVALGFVFQARRRRGHFD